MAHSKGIAMLWSLLDKSYLPNTKGIPKNPDTLFPSFEGFSHFHRYAEDNTINSRKTILLMASTAHILSF